MTHTPAAESLHVASFRRFANARVWLRLAHAAAITATLGFAALPSEAAFPGENGRVAYVSFGDFGASYNKIFVTGFGQLTFGTDSQYDFYPAFSRDGARVAFVRQTVGSHRIMTVPSTGGGLTQLASSVSFAGIAGSVGFASPAFAPDGRVSFVVASSDDRSGIWTVGGTAGLTQTVREQFIGYLEWSPVGDELAYTCHFRRGSDGRILIELCTHDQHTGITRQLPIELPGLWSVYDPRWTPDGKKIVFAAFYQPTEGTHPVERRDIFVINANGAGLRPITDSGPDPCPQAPSNSASGASYAFERPTLSPDGTSLLVWKRPIAGSGCHPYSYARGELQIMSLNGGGTAAPLIVTPAFSTGETAWQPLPADLTVKIDDGHGHPLDDLKVQLRHPSSGAIILENPIHEGNGTYVFRDVPPIDPPNDYVVRSTLIDHSGGPGSSPAFEIRHNLEPTEAAWVEHSVTVPATGGKVAHLPFEEQIFVPADADPLIASSVAQTHWDRLDDMAAIYYHLQRYVAWVKRTLTPVTGEKVELYAFAETDWFNVQPVDPNTAYYRPSQSEIIYGTEFSRYEYRDGAYSDAYGDEAPENGEWHEYNHHLWYTFIDTAVAGCSGVNHDGYKNPDTCDSMNEGLAAFLAAAAARDLDGASDSYYDGLWDLEPPLKAWNSRTGSSGRRSNAEDLAVSALLWDLHDAAADRHDTQVIAQDGSHQPVTYTDQESNSIGELWTHIANARPRTVYDLRVSYGIPDLTIDLDGDGINDIAPIDQVFLMHGFFAVDHDQTLTTSHKTYHYDVNYAQRVVATAPRNGAVGITNHRAFSADGTVTQTIIPRFQITSDPSANVAIDIQDASGTPLAGAEVDLVIQYPSQQQTVSTRLLGSGDANLAYLELVPYFDYLLPDDAPLPECDPTNDVQVTVTIRARVNGYQSPDNPSFDNCTYQRAVAAATSAAALAVTTTFPEDSTPPESTIDTVASDALVGGATRGFWIVRLACNDPADSGFAAGCARTEYRLDGGSIATYVDQVTVNQPGVHTFEFRSIDAAANEEPFQSIELAVVADSDLDGLLDFQDNCTLVANTDQHDTNQDGYGNLCDADLNNSGLTTATDFNLLRSCLNQAGYPGGTALCQAADLNTSGLVTTTDFNILRTLLNGSPGPSGLACAGSIPCTAP